MFTLLCCLVALSSTARAEAEPLVRVLLSEIPGALTFDMPGGHRGYTDDGTLFHTALGLSWPLQAQGGMLWSDGLALGRSVTLEPFEQGFVLWQGRYYRGALRFIAEGDVVQVINVLLLEDYLRGVVPAEMQASWPLEALKAQAVAARSYTLSTLQPEADYDICATVACQVYGGASLEHRNSNRAIDETRGLVLRYQDGFAQAVYHSDSGGYTASSAEVWGNNYSYLRARPDIDMETPHRAWQHRLDSQHIVTTLRQQGIYIGTIEAMHVTARSDSQRVSRVEFVGSQGRASLGEPGLHGILRSWGLKSTRFQMIGSLTAQGDGWGHGVGMSQYGALTLAQRGESYEDILAFYYPHTELHAWSIPQLQQVLESQGVHFSHNPVRFSQEYLAQHSSER